ncbi:MAG: ribosomal protein S18-alanine N-acetyltransferase, partial [Candidatus Neomarinimicrobiota bacterium]
LMGYLMAHVIADVVNLNNLAVDLPVQHRGIGQRLMRSFLERLNGFNIRKVFLEVADTNLPAIRFYEKFGFSEIAVRRKYYHTGEDALVMVKEVSAYGLVQT